MSSFGPVLVVISYLFHLAQPGALNWEYCVIGAGPGGLQLGWYLQQAGRDYVIFEKANISGNFFATYPRHDKLISINKRHTGKTNTEFNFRHDWNSLISDDESLLFRHYSKDMFPAREVMVQYLNDYEKKLGLNVQYQTEISDVKREPCRGGQVFTMRDQNQNQYTCRTLVVATGLATPNVPDFEGNEHTVGYETMRLDPDFYEGKTVLILGRGNAAFETADSIYGSTNVVHMVSRTRTRLSWATHYVGDLRAVNNNLLDTYQLKSMDGLLETPVEGLKVEKVGDKFKVSSMDDEGSADHENIDDNFALRDNYDVIIRCLGFRFDKSIFNDTRKFSTGMGRRRKYPKLGHDYQSHDLAGMYYAGTVSHYLDFRKSAGGFVHGFRYTARALHRILEWRNHGVKWPSVRHPVSQLLNMLVRRINEGSGIYQMFQMLGDVVIFRNNGAEFEYLEEVPIHLLDDLEDVTGHKDVKDVLILSLEYGANFSGPGNDIFSSDRAVGAPSLASASNFLHPVFYYYKTLPTDADFAKKGKKETLPQPDLIHHTVEDFLTLWFAPITHILPLRRFLEAATGTDMRHQFAEQCMRISLSSRTLPLDCRQYTDNRGIHATFDQYLQSGTLGIADDLMFSAAR